MCKDKLDEGNGLKKYIECSENNIFKSQEYYDNLLKEKESGYPETLSKDVAHRLAVNEISDIMDRAMVRQSIFIINRFYILYEKYLKKEFLYKKYRNLTKKELKKHLGIVDSTYDIINYIIVTFMSKKNFELFKYDYTGLFNPVNE